MRAKSDLDIVRFPVLFYFVAVLLLVASAYLLYSALGGRAGIPGFTQKYSCSEKTLVAVRRSRCPGLRLRPYFLLRRGGRGERGWGETILLEVSIPLGRSMAIGCKRIDWNEREVADLLSVVIVKRGYESKVALK